MVATAASNFSQYPSDWPLGGGKCGNLLKAADWSQSSLGPIEGWSPSLRTSVDIVLHSPMPMVLMWGEEHVMIYNDHYIPIARDKHPKAFGGVVPEVWPEIWEWNREMLSAGFRGEQRVYPDHLLKLRRNGRLEDVWFDLYYTPVYEASGGVAGVLCTPHVTTDRVVAKKALNESEQRFRQIVENSPDLIFINQNDRITFVNSAGVALLGASAAEQIVGRSPLEFFQPAYQDLVRKRIAEVLKVPQTAPVVESRIIGLHGNVLDVETRATSFVSDDGMAIQVVCRNLTPWKAAQAKLDENQRLLAIAGHAGRIGGWLVDVDESRLTWSDEVCSIHEVASGTTPTVEQAVAFYPPEWRKRVWQAYSSCVEDGIAFDEEREIITAGGDRKWIRAVGHAVRDDSGAVIQIQGAFQDISDRKRAELLLSESQRQFQEHADAMPFIVWTATPEGLLDYASREMRAYTGRPDEEMLGERWAETVHPDDLAGCLAAWAAAIASGDRYEYEFRIRQHDGAYRWHSISAIALRGPDGRVSRWIGTAFDTHERKLAERDAERLTQRLTTTLGSITDGFLTLDREWRITYLNAEAERLLRRPHGQLLGKKHWDEFPEAINTPVYEAAILAAEEGRKISLEMQYEPLDAWFAISIYPSPDGIALYFQDITRRRNDEQQLRLLEASIAKINDIVIITDGEPLGEPGPRIVFVNDAFVERTGYRRDEVMGRSPRFLQGPKTQRSELDRLRAALAKGENVRAELINYTKKGEEFWLELDIAPIIDAHGIATHFVAVERDVTERKQAQHALRESEARFRTVAKATADLVWDWDITTDQVWWNDEILNLYGRMPAPDEPGMLAWSERLHPEDRDRVLLSIKSAVAGADEYWSAEYRLVRLDGSVVHLIDSAFIVRSSNGAATRMIGGMRDVTSDVEVEAKLRQSQRLETIGQLTGGVAHDFNNLLTVILGNAEILADRLSGDQQLQLLAEMTKTAAERGADLTHRLLAFARRQPLEPSSVDVNSLVSGMDALLRRTLTEDIEIEFALTRGLWDAHVDAPQLESALLNLAINARDAMPDGGRLTIETANVHLDDERAAKEDDVAPGQYVAVAVSDNGTGMSREILEQAFQPFFTTKEAGKGSGLGLSMVYGFTKQLGGHVKIYAEAGQGTTVRLYLPRAAGETDEADVTAEGSEPIRGREKVLVVEDDALVRSHVTAQLISLGYRVIAVSNGPEALQSIMQEDDFDLIFTDVVMPGGLNGRQLAEEVSKFRPNLPILFTSGYAENAIVHHGRLDPGVHLLSKPYRRSELADKVRLVLGEQPSNLH